MRLQLEVSAVQADELSVARQVSESLLAAAGKHEVPVAVELALRPLTHSCAPGESSLSDRQSVDNQLRFYTSERCLRQYKAFGHWLANEVGLAEVVIRCEGLPTRGDWEFLEVLSRYLECSTEVRHVHPRKETPHPINTATARRDLEELLNAGDSWSASALSDRLLADASINSEAILDAAESIALSFGLQGRYGDAQLAFDLWETRGGLDAARARYSAALMKARHFPTQHRSVDEAGALLDDAWVVLQGSARSGSRDYERVFNRNGKALVLYRRREFRRAALLLEACIRLIRQIGHSGTVHETVLASNLGRVYSKAGANERAEKWLTEATRLDPQFADYWYDLAIFYFRSGRLLDAIDPARNACALNPTYPEFPTLLGNIKIELGDYESALQTFEDALSMTPGFSPALLGKARALASADQYQAALEVLGRVHLPNLGEADQSTATLLRVEAELNLGSFSIADAVAEVLDLTQRFPEDAAAAGSLELLESMERSS